MPGKIVTVSSRAPFSWLNDPSEKGKIYCLFSHRNTREELRFYTYLGHIPTWFNHRFQGNRSGGFQRWGHKHSKVRVFKTKHSKTKCKALQQAV